ncbi:hypothetical protein Pmar_PMAR020493 [Perkinsus marinus ATCC 50983]|uniref:J domain-containing protein n=1 Tax=Perkinsus marinus (strain ATCC 50983 / TXsc) TaxID=423536 RepID=C5L766_PERM5|nr:hypothetical protein Pmar_PMAR020493 [Perkinsus marinus ATCC 50983]EER07328.1 hypothetical protein Pmar_PMAR020493 [Perkinsus marinus ATCC 50983]|eukprot:XP_002775512.1 hypothetical protein Pmar_PMAR020493 [Perkinsus marinus ATCC 50983]
MSLRMRVSAAESGVNLRNEFFRVPILPLDSGARNSDVPSVEEKWKQEEPGYLDIVDEALKAFRVDILALGTYRGTEGGGGGGGPHMRDRFRTMDNYDRVMTYLMVWIHRCLCITIEAIRDGDTQSDAADNNSGRCSQSGGRMSKDRLLWILKDASIDADKDGESISDWKRTLLLLREETDVSSISSDDLEDLGAYFLHLRNITVDRYSALGLTRTASEVEIKRAYRQQALRWHPDKNQDNIDEATERFQQIGRAYEILGDSQRRRRYNINDILLWWAISRRYDLEGSIDDDAAFEEQNMDDFLNLFAGAMGGGFMGPGVFFGGGGGFFGGPQFYTVDSDDDDDDYDEEDFFDELLGGGRSSRTRHRRDVTEDFIAAMMFDRIFTRGWHRSGDDEDWETVEEDDDDDDDDDDSLLEALFLDRFAHPVMNQPTRGGPMRFKCGVCRSCLAGTGSGGKTYNENGIHRHITEDHQNWLLRFREIIEEEAADIFDLDDDALEEALDAVQKEMGKSKATSQHFSYGFGCFGAAHLRWPVEIQKNNKRTVYILAFL